MSATEKAPSSVSQRGAAAENDSRAIRGTGPGVPPSSEYGSGAPAGLSEFVVRDPESWQAVAAAGRKHA